MTVTNQVRSQGTEGAAGEKPSGRRRTRLRARMPLPLAVILAIAVVLRVLVWIAYSPAIMSVADTANYFGMAHYELFSGATQSAGYPAFLRALHALSNQLEVTIAVQHVLGLATGLLLYAIVRRAGAPVWAATVAAACILLSLDQVFLEHTIMSETLFTFVLVAASGCALRALEPPRTLRRGVTSRLLWIAAAGALIGASAWIRTYTVLLLPPLGLWLLFALPRPWRGRVTGAATGVVAGVLVVLIYAGAQYAYSDYFGLARSGGWALYSRTAQFADCDRFTPPAGTRVLCESTPPAQRPGPDFYGWEQGSPARKAFGTQPSHDAQLQAFATAAILHQPLDYLRTVANDTVRYFVPGWDAGRPFAGVDYTVMDLDRRAPGIEQALERDLGGYYAPDHLRIRGGVFALTDLQQLLRVQPLLLLQFVLLAVAGLVATRDRRRAAIAFLLGISLLLIVIPPATAIYGARYAIPIDGLLAAAAMLGLCALLDRRRARTAQTAE
jgi:hypothetical protein